MGLFITFFSCDNKPNSFEKNKIWEEFKLNLSKDNIDYLISNSTDFIKCTDCNPLISEKLYNPKTVFLNYKSKFYNIDLLDNKDYFFYSNDSILRINYSFETWIGNENYNIIYMFDKIDNTFLLTGKIVVP